MLRVQSAPVRDSERLMGYRMADRAPDVDNTNTSLQETFSIGTKMPVDASNTSVECLVDVNPFLRIATVNFHEMIQMGIHAYHRTTEELARSRVCTRLATATSVSTYLLTHQEP